MIRADVEAIGHVSPRPRIDLNARQPRGQDPVVIVSILELLERDRVWKLVVEVSR